MYFAYRGDVVGCLGTTVEEDNHWMDIHYFVCVWLLQGVHRASFDDETSALIRRIAEGETAPVARSQFDGKGVAAKEQVETQNVTLESVPRPESTVTPS